MNATASTQSGAPEAEKITARVNREVTEQYAEDAPFLFLQRGRALRAHRTRLGDLRRLDERLEANIDGLYTAGDAGWELASAALSEGSPAGVFTAACLAILSERNERLDAVLDRALVQPGLAEALVSAAAFIRSPQSISSLRSIFKSERRGACEAALKGFAELRADPDEVLKNLALSSRPTVQAMAFRLAGVTGRRDLVYLMTRQIGTPHSAHQDKETNLVQFHAAWSAARLGCRDRDVLEMLRKFAEENSPFAEESMQMTALCMNGEEARTWLSSLVGRGRTPRWVASACAVLGDPFLLMQCKGLLEREDTARIAGEVFARITGVDLESAGLTGPKPENFAWGPDDDPENPNVEMDLDEGLPWPSPERIDAWWAENARLFEHGAPYANGRLADLQCLEETLFAGCQPSRAGAALRLAVAHPGEHLFPVYAHARRQLQLLGKQRNTKGRRSDVVA